MPVDAELLEILACPACKTPVTLVKDGTALKCGSCHRVYPIKDDIPVMLIPEATTVDEAERVRLVVAVRRTASGLQARLGHRN